MGYTHYMPHTAINQQTWGPILRDIQKLYENLPEDIVLTGCSKYGTEPHLGRDEIWFNGDPDHETFVLSAVGSNGFAFCKTAYKPYDLMVCACLLVYKHHSPDTMELGSDGDSDDWAEAEKFVKDTLGYEIKYEDVNKYGEEG